MHGPISEGAWHTALQLMEKGCYSQSEKVDMHCMGRDYALAREYLRKQHIEKLILRAGL